MPYLQEVIHKLEVGPWIRYLKIGLAALALVGLVAGYNWRSFRNFGSQEAMDSAQLARNLAQGKGYTTLFVRPLSIYLVKQRNGADAAASNDPARIKQSHPDLANPPVYPLALAALMKVMRLNWAINPTKPFWSQDGQFLRYKPDFVISVFNEMIFFALIVLTFLLARRLFDPGVAWLSGFLLLGSELLWRFSVSGLSTILLMLVFVGLAWCLVLLEQEAREPKGGDRKLFLLGATAGLLLGLGMLTRYSFGWLILPVSVYLLLFGGPRKAALCLMTLAMFLLVVSPWIYRNVKISGMPFGTATFAVLEGSFFPGNQLARSLQPDFVSAFPSRSDTILPFTYKLFGNTRQVLQSELPKLGGSWLTALFLAGLLLGFRNPAIRRLRYFLMMSLATFVVVQALGRTQLTDDSPELNSENLLVLLVPLVFVYGVSLFYLMLDQMNLAFLALRPIVVGVFGFVMVLPMLFTFLPPRTSPVLFPPYHPYAIQQVSGWMKENELMMSDVPWAVAWYGQRQCIWLTLKTGLNAATGQTSDTGESFYAVNDLLKAVSGMYLTSQTLDLQFVSHWIKPGTQGWGVFLLDSIMLRRAILPAFPLHEAAPGFLPNHLFLSNRKRWGSEAPAMPPVTKPATTEQPATMEKPAASEKPSE